MNNDNFLPPFRCGHPRSRGNIMVRKGVGVCRECIHTQNRRALLLAAISEKPHLYPSQPA